MKLKFPSLFPALCKNLQVAFGTMSDLKCYTLGKARAKKKLINNNNNNNNKNRHWFPQQQIKP